MSFIWFYRNRTMKIATEIIAYLYAHFNLHSDHIWLEMTIFTHQLTQLFNLKGHEIIFIWFLTLERDIKRHVDYKIMADHVDVCSKWVAMLDFSSNMSSKCKLYMSGVWNFNLTISVWQAPVTATVCMTLKYDRPLLWHWQCLLLK